MTKRKLAMKSIIRFAVRFGSVFLGLCILVWVLSQLTWYLSGAGQVNPEKLEKVAALQQRLNSNISKAVSPLNRTLSATVEALPQPKGKSITDKGGLRPKSVHSVAEWPEDRSRDFHEAPMLHQRVQSKELPPVGERLPENPLVVIPPDQMGPYGGTWTRFATGPSDIGIYKARLSYDGLVRWGPMGTKILPNLAARWEIEDEGRMYTFWLRRGVHWSDGHPFSVDDILFWYEYVLKNPDLTPTIPRQFQRDGEPMQVEKVDDYTVRFRFKTPYGLFLKVLASGRGYQVVDYPAHYLKQYHPDFVSQQRLEEMAKKAQFDFWYQLFEDRFEWRNRDTPRLWPWLVKKPPPAQPTIFERNPYYWKVDPEGNQLPYIDYMTFEIFDTETINLKAINGEMGMQGRHLQFDNYPLFTENSNHRGYRVLHWMSSGGGTVLAPNLNHKDPVLRKIIGDRRFRIALSHAIDRDELNQLSYFGVGTPRQVAPPPLSPFHEPEYERAYIEYDPETANRLLDEMGLSKRNRKGICLRPDGKPLQLLLRVTSV
ncbi:ABC transporter substrate-binding protein [Candidatus Poribacteria bacterium]|nr:ABC transporter substrate-binding protein [Candidatus Poribacteria bacterium]